MTDPSLLDKVSIVGSAVLEEGPDGLGGGLETALGEVGLSAAPSVEGGVEILYQGAQVAADLAHGLLIALAVAAGEDRAAAGEPWDGAGLPHQAGVVLQF